MYSNLVKVKSGFEQSLRMRKEENEMVASVQGGPSGRGQPFVDLKMWCCVLVQYKNFIL